jgi:hypothetical protein
MATSECILYSLLTVLCVVQVYHTDEKMVDTTNWSSCTCERGKYRCHHMAVAMIQANRTVSCTDKSCSWSQPKKSTGNQAAVRTISEMYPDKKIFSYLDRKMAEGVDWFHNKLQENDRYCSMLWYLSKEPEEILRPTPTIEDIMTSEAFLLQCDMPIMVV